MPPATSAELTLIAPIFAPCAPQFTDAAPRIGRLPALERLMSRSRVQESVPTAMVAALCALWGVPLPYPPVAPLTHLADSGETDDGWWLRADPVHLRADQDRLLLFGPALLDIEPAEAEALVAELNSFYCDQHWRFHAPVADRWYLRLSQPASLQTEPLEQVIGHDVRHYLPSGLDDAHWLRTLTEMQMLLHGSAVNQTRESAGIATINSLWLWGAGTLPYVTPNQWARVWADEPLARGLAQSSGAVVRNLPATAVDCLISADEQPVLVVADQIHHHRLYGDGDAWMTAMTDLERDWFAPLLDALRNRRLRSLDLLLGDGVRRRVTAAAIKHWWRRPQPWFA